MRTTDGNADVIGNHARGVVSQDDNMIVNSTSALGKNAEGGPHV